MTETFKQRRMRELGMASSTSGEEKMSFKQRRMIELGMVQPPEEPKRDLPTKLVLDDTLKSVMKPTTEPMKPIDFKTEVSKSQVSPKQESKLQGKLPAASLLNGDNSKPLQSSLNGKLPASSLITSTGGGPANADKIPGVSQYEINKKEIANDNAPKAVKAFANTMNYVTEGNPLGIAIGNAFSGNSGATLKDSSGNKTVDKISDAVNNFITPILTPTGAPVGQGIIGSSYEATGNALKGAAGQKLINGIATGVPFAGQAAARNITKVGLTEGIAGAMQGAGIGLQQGQDTGRDIAHNALMGAAGGAILGTAGAAVGEGISKLASMFRKSGLSEAEIAEIAPTLALPEANPRTVRKQLAGEIKTTANSDPITTPYTFKLGEATPETQAASTSRQGAGRDAVKVIDPVTDTKYQQSVIDEYKRLKADPNVKLSYKETYELAQKNMESAKPKNPLVETKLKDTRINGETPYTEPVIRNPKALTREQEVNNRVLAGGELTQQDIDFLFSKDYNPDNLYPESTPSESTYVKPKAEVKPSIKEEVAATVEADLKPVKKTIVTEVKKRPNLPAKPKVKGERGFVQTLRTSEKTPEGFSDNLDTTYEPTTNRGNLAKAEERIKDRAGATRYILEDQKGGMSPEQSITAQRLIDTHLREGNVKAAEEVADALLRESTRSAQFLQSLSVYNKLSPEGVFMVAKRIANKVNETSSKLAKKAEVTPQMADDIMNVATINQTMTGVKDLSNDVMDILKRAKDGAKLSETETSMLQKFVDDSRQFIKETAKKPIKTEPKIPKEKKVRDNVSNFLDRQEEAAKARLRAKGVRISSTPIDIWADYAIIGAAKMGKNVIKMSEWSESMVKDLGESIRPYLDNIYEKSREAYEMSSKKIRSQQVNSVESITKKALSGKPLEDHEIEAFMNLAIKVDNLSGEAKRVASQDLQVILQKLDRPTFAKKVSSLQTQAQLLNPKTMVRNVVGNELFYRLERINKYVATPIDIARSKVTGSYRQVTFRTHNQGKYWENWIEGGSAGNRGVNINGIETQYDLASPAFKGKYNPFRYTEKALGASLRSFDNAAYSRAVNKKLGELGTLDAINSGVKPTKEYVQEFIRKADENVMKIASDYGKYVTFQDSNLLSQGLTKFKKGLNFGKDFGAGDLIIKYPKTPGALLMRAIEYSPAGFLRSAKIVAEPLLRNGIEKNPGEAVEALSRAIIGTGGLSLLGYYLMDKDILTGAASMDKDIRSLQSAIGKGAYQVNLSALYRFVKSGFDDKEATIREGDQLYNYDWMQPISVAISLGANVKGNQSADSSKIASGALGIAYNSAAGALNTLSQQSVLQGVESALSGYTGQTTTDKLVSIIADMPASFIPTLSNQIKQSTDNTKRETYAPTIGEKTMNTVKAKIPFVAENLPKKYNTLGEEQKQYQNNSPFNVFVNPGFPAKYKLSPEARKIVDLITATGDESLAPRVPEKKVNGLVLSGEEYSTYARLQGEETKRLVAELDETMPITEQADEMESILREASKLAKEKLLETYPRLVKE